jgi:REP element-mobilizing transposase RayT
MEELYKNKYKIGSIRLPRYDYSDRGLYFITICTNNRINCLGEIKNGNICLSKIGEIVKQFWFGMSDNFNGIKLDEFIIMPNHLHGIIEIPSSGAVEAIHELPPTIRAPDETIYDRPETIHELSLQSPKNRRKMLIPKIIGKFKMQSAKSVNQLLNHQGQFWQPNYYEHIIRDEKELNRIRKYIIENPIKWEFDGNNLDNNH